MATETKESGIPASTMSAAAEASAMLEAYRGRTPGPYVPGTAWRTWWKLFNNFLLLRRVTEEIDKRLIFLQEIGSSNYELLESLLQGKELERVPLEELRDAMEHHFQPKKLLMAERFALMKKAQKPTQTLQEYFAEVQKAANECAFEKVKDFRDAMVTMVFIGGIGSLDTRKRLLEKEEMTAKEALEIAEAFERVGKNAPHLKEGTSTLGISVIRTKKVTPQVGKPRTEPRQKFIGKDTRPLRDNDVKKTRSWNARKVTCCRICGGKGHLASKCYFKGKAQCRVCSRPGHMARACWSKTPRDRWTTRKVNW